jgi:hypothetical protein
MEFNLVHLAITVRTENVPLLTHYLPLSGGSFANACRSLACRRPERVCISCSGQETCAWFLVFGQKLTSDPAELKRHQKPPLPFMFSFPQVIESAESGFEIICGLVVVGYAIAHIDMLIEGFTELLAGDSCPVSAAVVSLGARDYQGTVQPLGGADGIRHTQNLVVLSAAGLLDSLEWAGSLLTVRLLSPLRLYEDGRLLDRFDFSRFSRSLLRRVSSLAYYYGACECSSDFKELSRQADDVTCTESHYSLQSGAGSKMTGIGGYGRFRGDFSGLMPFLVLGSYVHVGKGASFGMGGYELSFGIEDETVERYVTNE